MNHDFALRLTDSLGVVARIRGIANFMGVSQLSDITPELKGEIVEVVLELDGQQPTAIGGSTVYQRIIKDDSLGDLVRLSIMDPEKLDYVLIAYEQGDTIFSAILEAPAVASATVYSQSDDPQTLLKAGSAANFELTSRSVGQVDIESSYSEEISVAKMLSELVTAEVPVYIKNNSPVLIESALEVIQELSGQMLELAEKSDVGNNQIFVVGMKNLVHAQKSLDLLLKGTQVASGNKLHLEF
ncbi:hypothetical protein ACKF11_13900 [Methylobacillus sp. Pita2]|uniref:hypothetical protein n=1 Tax=Methylobacillus sp. Pita2 TaxID=3383245 RepID=UPI0038B626C8